MIPDLEEADIEMQNSLIHLVKRLAPQSNLLIKNPTTQLPPPGTVSGALSSSVLAPGDVFCHLRLSAAPGTSDALRAEIDCGEGLDERQATRTASGLIPNTGMRRLR